MIRSGHSFCVTLSGGVRRGDSSDNNTLTLIHNTQIKLDYSPSIIKYPWELLSEFTVCVCIRPNLRPSVRPSVCAITLKPLGIFRNLVSAEDQGSPLPHFQIWFLTLRVRTLGSVYFIFMGWNLIHRYSWSSEIRVSSLISTSGSMLVQGSIKV